MHIATHDIHMADHVFTVLVTGDAVKIEVIKTRNGLALSEDDPRLESLRAAIHRYIDGDVS